MGKRGKYRPSERKLFRKRHYDIYVDGSPGPVDEKAHSAWGMSVFKDRRFLFARSGLIERRCTNNAAEIEALIQGLVYAAGLPKGSGATVWSDSRYVVNGVSSVFRIAAAGFKRNGKTVPNVKLWRIVFSLMAEGELAGRVAVRWLRGHAGIPGNEIADKLAGETSSCGKTRFKKAWDGKTNLYC